MLFDIVFALVLVVGLDLSTYLSARLILVVDSKWPLIWAAELARGNVLIFVSNIIVLVLFCGAVYAYIRLKPLAEIESFLVVVVWLIAVWLLIQVLSLHRLDQGFRRRSLWQTARERSEMCAICWASSARHTICIMAIPLIVSLPLFFVIVVTIGWSPVYPPIVIAWLGSLGVLVMDMTRVPNILLLAASREAAIELQLELRKGPAALARVTSLLRPSDFRWLRPWHFERLNFLRNRDSVSWPSVVGRLMDLAHIIIIDARVLSEPVMQEINLSLTANRVYKVIVVPPEDCIIEADSSLMDRGATMAHRAAQVAEYSLPEFVNEVLRTDYAIVGPEHTMGDIVEKLGDCSGEARRLELRASL